jgi:hypothetical protein
VNNFENKTTILAELWMNYREDDQIKDFVDYNDLGLPLAYLITNEIVIPTHQAEIYINESYDLLVAALEVEDIEYESLDEMMDTTEE